jgi:hypothetical protein
MQQPYTLTAYYERKLSDGAYGSEGFSLGLTLSLPVGSDERAEVERVHALLRDFVLERLAASSNGRVAFTANRELHHQEDERAHSNAASEERAIRGDRDEEEEDLPY